MSEVYKCLARRDTDKQTTVSIMYGVSAAKLEEARINRQRQAHCTVSEVVQMPS